MIYHNDILMYDISFERVKSVPKVNKTKYAILGVLSVAPSSGYDIKKFCDKSISHFWNENFGHIYPVLKNMELEELISKEVEYTEGKPPRNIYSITEKGRSELREWLQLPVENAPLRVEQLIKLFFGGNINIEYSIRMIEAEKASCKEKLEKFYPIEKRIMEEAADKDSIHKVLWLSTVRYGISDARARLEWCQQTLTSLYEAQNRLNVKEQK